MIFQCMDRTFYFIQQWNTGLFPLLGDYNNAVNICVHIFVEHRLSMFLGLSLGVELLGRMVTHA